VPPVTLRWHVETVDPARATAVSRVRLATFTGPAALTAVLAAVVAVLAVLAAGWARRRAGWHALPEVRS
jgi:hypothetical protein